MERVFAAMRSIPQITVFPTKANFVTFRTKKPLFDALLARGILVRDRSHELPGWVRITLGALPQTRRLIRALRAVL